MKKYPNAEDGGTIIVVIITLLILSSFVALSVDYTANVARNGQRDRTFNSAVEIGDGCLELAFQSWRQLSKSTESPSTSAFSAMPTPTSSMFPSFPNATITNFNVQAMTPTLSTTTDDPPTSTLGPSDLPPKSTGPGTGSFSYFYLATVDVALPVSYKYFLNGAETKTLTAKVRRVFEKRYTSAWDWAIFYNGDLELHPDAKLTLDGWVHSNSTVYIGNGSYDSSVTPASTTTLLDRLTYAGGYNVGFSPNDTAHTGQVNVAAPTVPADLPPGLEQYYLPLGWDSTQFNTSDSNQDNDSYHEMIEKPSVPWSSTSTTDPFKDQRLYNQAYNIPDANGDYGIVVNVDATNNVSVGYNGVTYTSDPGGSGANDAAWDAVKKAIQTNVTIQDGRVGGTSGNGTVRLVDFDIAKFMAEGTKNWNGILYINDTSGSSTTNRAVRIKNGAKLPSSGMTIVSPNPLYIQGDFNSGRTSTVEPPSNTGTYTDSDATGYSRAPASIIADAITLLSNNWNDANSGAGLSSRIATNTTVNAALVAGNVPSDGANYSGGAENFVRFLENWTGKDFTYYGSMLCLYQSQQAIGKWGTLGVYGAPTQRWFFDRGLSVDSSGNPVAVPGYVSTVAYLQQQRWYLQY